MPGEILRKKREESGQNLKEIAHTLKIRYDYLKALEAGEFEKLPVPVYTKGYIRDYAKFLNVDPEPIISAYMEKVSPKPEKPATPPEAEHPAKPRTKYFILIFIISVIVASYFLIKTLPKTPEPIPQKAATVPPPEVPAQQPSQPTPQPQEEKISSEKNVPEGRYILDISAEDTTWVMIVMDGTESKELLMKPGESAKFSAMQGFSLKIGNAGGVKLSLNGKDLGAPGNKGQVINLKLPQEDTSTPQ